MPTTLQAGIAATVVFLAHAGSLLAWPDRGLLHTRLDLLFPAMGLIYVPLAARAARLSRGRMRAAWWTMTAAFACWALGELIWTSYEIADGEVPFPSWADAAYLAYVPGVLAALLLFPVRGTWRDEGWFRDKGRMVLDGLIMTGSFFLISWLTALRTFWRDDSDGGLGSAITMAYRIGDVLIVSVGLLVLIRAPAGLRLTMTLLVSGFVCSAVGTGLWSYMTGSGGNAADDIADVFYAANSLLVIVALVAAQHAKPATDGTAHPPGWFSLWVPLVPLAVAAVLAARAQPGVATEAPVVVTGGLLIVATLARQLAESAELVRRERRIRLLADQLNSELNSASDYVASILPGELTEPVAVRSRYLPSRAVGGDCFGYQWIDEDHLIVYLIDVSGHGVRPALLSVSVHNLLRSGALPKDFLLQPGLVLAELNARFTMDNQDGHYFTIWYGVYELSTGVLRYANGGHPPPLIATAPNDWQRLDGVSVPLGLFADTDFPVAELGVPAGARILLYSDGALGDHSRIEELTALCGESAGPDSTWLDALVDRLPLATNGHDTGDEDDCSLVELEFIAPTDRPIAPPAAAPPVPAAARV